MIYIIHILKNSKGSLDVKKEIVIFNRNKWPTGLENWKGLTKKIVKSFTIGEKVKGEHFGEGSILAKSIYFFYTIFFFLSSLFTSSSSPSIFFVYLTSLLT